MFEVELKAVVNDAALLKSKLQGLQPLEVTDCVYNDRYFDTAEFTLNKTQHELRIRSAKEVNQERHSLTAKTAPFDEISKSKREFEITISDPHTVEQLLNTIGFKLDIVLTKNCQNYLLDFKGFRILATIVAVKELPNLFLEVETVVDNKSQTQLAMRTLRDLLIYLNVPEDALTVEYYTDAIRAARQRNS